MLQITRQIAKFKSTPNIPAVCIRIYIYIYIYIYILVINVTVACVRGCTASVSLLVTKRFNQISKIQNNLMRSFLGVGRNAPIVTLLGDMEWVPMSIITKLSSITFWLRLSNNFMSHDRLNDKVFTD